MDQTSDKQANSKFVFNPTNKVIGILDDAGDAQAALRDLRAVGFRTEQLEFLTNEEGAQQIELTGEEREVSMHVIGSNERPQAFYDAPGLIAQIEEELKAGHYGIGVGATDSEARERVREILKSHGGHYINYYGTWAVEALEP
jgi:hypothetical protein